MKTWIAHRPALSYYFLTLLLSWGYWLSLLALGIHAGPDSIAHFPGLLGPMLAAIIITAVVGRHQALQELFGRMLKLRPHPFAKLLLALSPLALGAVACISIFLLGKPLPALATFTHIPGLPEALPVAVVLVAVIIINGFGEETGWRGFLLERLLQEHGRLRATLVVAVAWALWHLPLFWLNSSMAGLPWLTRLGWLFAIVCGAYVLAQVYLATGHSILCAALWHVGFNMMVSTDAAGGWFAGIVSTAVMVWGFVVALLWLRIPTEPAKHKASPRPVKPPATNEVGE